MGHRIYISAFCERFITSIRIIDILSDREQPSSAFIVGMIKGLSSPIMFGCADTQTPRAIIVIVMASHTLRSGRQVSIPVCISLYSPRVGKCHVWSP